MVLKRGFRAGQLDHPTQCRTGASSFGPAQRPRDQPVQVGDDVREDAALGVVCLLLRVERAIAARLTPSALRWAVQCLPWTAPFGFLPKRPPPGRVPQQTLTDPRRARQGVSPGAWPPVVTREDNQAVPRRGLACVGPQPNQGHGRYLESFEDARPRQARTATRQSVRLVARPPGSGATANLSLGSRRQRKLTIAG